MKPNILLIITDQHRWDALGCTGGWLKTPNLDRIAAEGVRFTNAVTNCPVCVPARLSLARGLYPHNTGVWENASLQGIPVTPNWMQMVRAAGYRTALIGTDGLCARPRNVQQVPELIRIMSEAGLDDVTELGSYGEYAQDLERAGIKRVLNKVKPLKNGGQGSVEYIGPGEYPPELHIDGWIGRRAQRYLAEYVRSEPWCCWVGFFGPHPPYNAPEPYASMYDPAAMPRPIPRYDWIQNLRPNMLQHIFTKYPSLAPETAARARANYAGKVTQIDDRIGGILKTIEQRGELDNTVIVFSTDHGSLNGDLGLTHKRSFFNGAIRIPLIIRTPATARAASGGAVCDSPCELMDIGASMVEYAGGKITHDHFARSLAPVVADPRREHRSEAVSEYRGEQMILTREWKMVVTSDGRSLMLFDVRNDPLEAVNLAGRPECAGIENELSLRLYRHLLSSQVQILNYWR